MFWYSSHTLNFCLKLRVLWKYKPITVWKILEKCEARGFILALFKTSALKVAFDNWSIMKIDLVASWNCFTEGLLTRTVEKEIFCVKSLMAMKKFKLYWPHQLSSVCFFLQIVRFVFNVGRRDPRALHFLAEIQEF